MAVSRLLLSTSSVQSRKQRDRGLLRLPMLLAVSDNCVLENRYGLLFKVTKWASSGDIGTYCICAKASFKHLC